MLAPNVRSAISTRRAVSAGSAPVWVSRPGAARRFTRGTPTTRVRVRSGTACAGSAVAATACARFSTALSTRGSEAVSTYPVTPSLSPTVSSTTGRKSRAEAANACARAVTLAGSGHPVVGADQPP